MGINKKTTNGSITERKPADGRRADAEVDGGGVVTGLGMVDNGPDVEVGKVGFGLGAGLGKVGSGPEVSTDDGIPPPPPEHELGDDPKERPKSAVLDRLVSCHWALHWGKK